MARNRQNKSTETAETTETTETTAATVSPQPEVEAPEGYDDLDSDLAGFYDGASQVHIRPLGFTASDPKKLRNGKPSVLIHVELLAPVNMPNFEEEMVQFEAGSRIGIWYKPGMRKLIECYDSPTFLAPNGERDVGQPLPMKLFKVARKKGCTAKPVPCLGDYRKDTRRMPLPWESNEPAASTLNARRESLPVDDSDIPF